MYRQTNEALKRGDVFQQRPCPFYNEMHRIFSGTDENNSSSNSQLINDDEEEEEGEEINDENQEEISPDDRFSQAIDRLISYQQQNEVLHFEKALLLFEINRIHFLRIVGINISNNKPILSNNVEKKIGLFNFN